MKLLADEGIDGPIVARLRQEGHEVAYVAELEPGIDDEAILDLARRDGALLVTSDKDFGELIFRQGRAPSGVLLLRLAGLSPPTKSDLVAGAVASHAEELIGAFSVLAPGQLRLRRSSDSGDG